MEKNASQNTVVSGAADTNVKMWDLRQKTCVNTYKGHTKDITCVDLSPDSKVIISGSLDGTIRIWDTCMQKMIQTIKGASTGQGNPVCICCNPRDLCVAVGFSNKCIKYWELQNFECISQTSIENFVPRKIQFDHDGIACYVAFDDCTKVFFMDDEVKPRLLDIIAKPYR